MIPRVRTAEVSVTHAPLCAADGNLEYTVTIEVPFDVAGTTSTRVRVMFRVNVDRFSTQHQTQSAANAPSVARVTRVAPGPTGEPYCVIIREL